MKLVRDYRTNRIGNRAQRAFASSVSALARPKMNSASDVPDEIFAMHDQVHGFILIFSIHPTFVWVTEAGYRLRPPQWK